MSAHGSSRMPKYHRIAEAIRADVRAGTLQPGDRLPAETAIAHDHSTSVPTVRQAMAVLRAEGLIESRHGVGTFVKAESRLQRRSRNRYGEARGRSGLLTNTLRHDITSAGPEPAPERIAELMGRPAEETVVVRRRDLYDESDQLQEIGASYLPADFAADTYLAQPKVVPKALFRCVEEITGRTYHHATDHWVARPATQEETDRFDLTIGAYVLHVVHVARDESGDVLEVSESIWPADRVAFIDDYEIPEAPAEEPTKSDV
jgi:GntR family transcriptional regulator